ncbi:MAG: c-type cytochrome [Gammaproteobacteria bacterium]|nr:c-type cytochrome [Gammaproteobacteria bacterium]
MDKAKDMVDVSAGGLAAVSMEDGTALAKKSGCFACHSIDRKILGPSWKDVAAKYADDKAAGKAYLLTKVAKGGKGAWADAGIVAAMPPYSPRVSDENIEILVDFILAL